MTAIALQRPAQYQWGIGNHCGIGADPARLRELAIDVNRHLTGQPVDDARYMHPIAEGYPTVTGLYGLVPAAVRRIDVDRTTVADPHRVAAISIVIAGPLVENRHPAVGKAVDLDPGLHRHLLELVDRRAVGDLEVIDAGKSKPTAGLAVDPPGAGIRIGIAQHNRQCLRHHLVDRKLIWNRIDSVVLHAAFDHQRIGAGVGQGAQVYVLETAGTEVLVAERIDQPPIHITGAGSQRLHVEVKRIARLGIEAIQFGLIERRQGRCDRLAEIDDRLCRSQVEQGKGVGIGLRTTRIDLEGVIARFRGNDRVGAADLGIGTAQVADDVEAVVADQPDFDTVVVAEGIEHQTCVFAQREPVAVHLPRHIDPADDRIGMAGKAVVNTRGNAVRSGVRDGCSSGRHIVQWQPYLETGLVALKPRHVVVGDLRCGACNGPDAHVLYAPLERVVIGVVLEGITNAQRQIVAHGRPGAQPGRARHQLAIDIDAQGSVGPVYHTGHMAPTIQGDDTGR